MSVVFPTSELKPLTATIAGRFIGVTMATSFGPDFSRRQVRPLDCWQLRDGVAMTITVTQHTTINTRREKGD
jgi:hypothetical protein